jgi:hypothetical protein
MPGHVVCEQVDPGHPFVPINCRESGLGSWGNSDELALGTPGSSQHMEETAGSGTRCTLATLCH